MELLDIMDEISEKQKQRTQTGDLRIDGLMIGIVVENYHRDMPGRVRVKIPVRDEEANILRWAKVARAYGGKEWGMYFLPEKDDQVLLAFVDGNIEMPYIIASVPRDNDKAVKEACDEDNQIKEIVARHGSRLTFTDHKSGGDKDKIMLSTAGAALKLSLDNDKQKILAADKEENCVIGMNAGDGEITVTAAKKLTVKVGDSIEVTMNGSSGTVSIKADKVDLKTSRAMSLKSDGTLKVSGQQTSVEASATLKQSSSGMVTISGSPVKIG